MQTLLSPETQNVIEDVTRRRLARSALRRPATQQQVLNAVRSVLDRTEQRTAGSERHFSLTRAVRGLSALNARAIAPETAEGDVRYVKGLSPATAPGSYLYPANAATRVVAQLALVASSRVAGSTVWEMPGMQELKIPVALTTPDFVFVAPNSQQTPTDPNLGQIDFNLKEQQALVLLPTGFFKSMSPAFDVLAEDSLILGLAEGEDVAMHATATLTSSPTALMSKSGINVSMVGGSASGGNIARSDIKALIKTAAESKVRLPWAFFMNPRTLDRLLDLDDASSHAYLSPGDRDAALGRGIHVAGPSGLRDQFDSDRRGQRQRHRSKSHRADEPGQHPYWRVRAA